MTDTTEVNKAYFKYAAAVEPPRPFLPMGRLLVTAG